MTVHHYLVPGSLLQDTVIVIDHELTEMMLSCGAMLLARLIGAACRVKRDNDLMI